MDVGNTSKRKASDDEDEDIPTSKRRRSGTVSKSNLFTLAKGKKGQSSEMNAQGPSEAVIANWSRGDADLEPSTKMQALVNYIKEWNSTGDKTICYSQCKLLSSCLHS